VEKTALIFCACRHHCFVETGDVSCTILGINSEFGAALLQQSPRESIHDILYDILKKVPYIQLLKNIQNYICMCIYIYISGSVFFKLIHEPEQFGYVGVAYPTDVAKWGRDQIYHSWFTGNRMTTFPMVPVSCNCCSSCGSNLMRCCRVFLGHMTYDAGHLGCDPRFGGSWSKMVTCRKDEKLNL
jgi:hypothetical protein